MIVAEPFQEFISKYWDMNDDESKPTGQSENSD